LVFYAILLLWDSLCCWCKPTFLWILQWIRPICYKKECIICVERCKHVNAHFSLKSKESGKFCSMQGSMIIRSPAMYSPGAWRKVTVSREWNFVKTKKLALLYIRTYSYVLWRLLKFGLAFCCDIKFKLFTCFYESLRVLLLKFFWTAFDQFCICSVVVEIFLKYPCLIGFLRTGKNRIFFTCYDVTYSWQIVCKGHKWPSSKMFIL
jgi:hypothetical protein